MTRPVASLAAAALWAAAGGCFDIPEPLEGPSAGGSGPAGGSSAAVGGDGGMAAGGAGDGCRMGSSCAVVEDGQCLTVKLIEAGGRHSCAVLSDDRLRCWGSNAYGELGDPGYHLPLSTTPRIVPGVTGVADLALGYFHTCVLLDDGQVRCWGRNHALQIGNGASPTESIEPVIEPYLLDLENITAIDARYHHTCAIEGDHTLWCWGFAIDGQRWYDDFEIGEANIVPTPKVQAGLEEVRSIDMFAAGAQHACVAIDGMTRVKCWGTNDWGALGDGTLVDSASAIFVSGFGDQNIEVKVELQYLAAASGHNCIVGWDGRQLRCWGFYGWLPLIQPAPSLFAVFDVPVVTVDGGWRSSCLLLDDGEVRCWGENNHLQLGQPGMEATYSKPLVVEGLPPIETLSMGRNHSCVVDHEQRVWCWGRNDFGQLGRGSDGPPEKNPDLVIW